MVETAVLPAQATNEVERKHPHLYYCKSRRYANYMLSKGSRMLQIQNDKYRPGYMVFVFLWDDVCDKNAKQWENGDRETYIGL